MSPVPPSPRVVTPNSANPPPPPVPSTSTSPTQIGLPQSSTSNTQSIKRPSENTVAAYPPDPKEDDEPLKPTTAWECIYVYTFIVKFLHGQGPPINDLFSTQDWENALLDPSFNQILYDVLRRLLELLRPKAVGTITPENITSILAEVCSHYCALDKYTVFWDETQGTNRKMFQSEGANFFVYGWESKLGTCRQLVDWCLCYSALKDTIDISWELKYQRKKKKTNKTMAAEFAPPDADDPMSMSSLQFVPLGQDAKRVRFWAVDLSPRLYTSYNPWRTFSTMQAVSNSMEDYNKVVASLRSRLPDNAFAPKVKLTKWEKEQIKLIQLLESRVPDIEKHEETVATRRVQRAKETERKLRKAEEGERRRQLVTSRTRSRTKQANDEGGDLQNDASASNGITQPDPAQNSKKRKRASSPGVVEADDATNPEGQSPGPQEVSGRSIDTAPLISSSAKGKVRSREVRAGKSAMLQEEDIDQQPDPDNASSQDPSEGSDIYDPSGDESVASVPTTKNRRKSGGHGERAFKASVPKDVPPPPEGSRRSSRLRREEAPPFVDIDDIAEITNRPSKKRKVASEQEQAATEASVVSSVTGRNDEEADIASSTTAIDNDTRHPSPAQDLKSTPQPNRIGKPGKEVEEVLSKDVSMEGI